MCGIAGIVQPGRDPGELREIAARMATLLAHRGPDGSGVLVDGPAALAHRRLTVIDLATGAQPMTDPTGRYSIVFNGEIYNYRELRERLQAEGLAFATASDTEVILNAYARHGAACLDLLDGMFAFAVWDGREKTLFAARDRLGKKPFYYHHGGGLFAFASELEALRAAVPGLSLDPASVAAFLCRKCVPCPATIYAGAAKLPPGCCLTWRAGELRVRSYWTPPEPGEAPAAPEEAGERLRELLGAAVRKRLVSDVPLGAFLSGGLDSTVVAALMARESTEPVRTFSVGFEEPSYDETPFALAAAEFAGTRHSVRVLDAASCAGMVREVAAGFDEPLADPSIVPTSLLSAFAREEVTVALSGDGADELFGGYEHLPACVWAGRLARGGAPVQAALRGLEALLPVSRGYVSPRHVLDRFRQAVAAPEERRLPRLLMAFAPEALEHVLLQPPGPDHDPLGAVEPGPGSTLDRALRHYLTRYLPDSILTKVDRCSMRHGLEVRSPFLDTAVVEFAARLPASFKMPGARRKRFMKQALGRYMPPVVRRRGKRGFLMPVAGWLAGSLGDLLRGQASPERLRRQGLFRPEALERLLREHESGAVDRREELWTFLVLQLWLESRGL